MARWNFSNALKPETVELTQKLVTIKGLKEWTPEKREEALKSVEGFIMGALRAAQGYYPGLEIIIDQADTRLSKPHRRR